MSQEQRALSDDETSSRIEHSVPTPLSRSLSFPLEVSFDEMQEIAAEVERESQAIADSLPQSIPTEDGDDSQDPNVLQKRRWEEIASSEPLHKKRRILTRARAARVTHLSDLINSGLLEVGDTITLKGHRGVVNRDGWIEYGDNMYPGAWTWCNAIKENQNDISLAVPLDDSLNTQTEEQLAWDRTLIESRDGAPLKDFRELYERESEFRSRLHSHKAKLLERRRKAQRRRENAHRGLPPSQEDDGDEEDPALYRSRLDSQSLEEAIDEDELEDYEPISPSKQKKRKRKPSSSTSRSPQKKRKRPQLPEKDFSEWTATVRSRKSPTQGRSPVPSPSASPVAAPVTSSPSTTTTTSVVRTEPAARIVPMEPLSLEAESEDFFALPDSEPLIPGASDSLNSVVGNLIHLGEETQTQSQVLLPDSHADEEYDIQMEDAPPRPGPNRIVDEDLPQPVPVQQESQEWISSRARSTSPYRSPAATVDPTRSRTAPIEISDSLEPISISDSMDVDVMTMGDVDMNEEPLPSPPQPSAEPSPAVQSPERSPAPASGPRSPSPSPPSSGSSSAPSSQSSQASTSASSSQTTNSPHSSQPSQTFTPAPSPVVAEPSEESVSLGTRTASAPEIEREKAYDEEEVFLVPSQPTPTKRSAVPTRVEPPLDSLASQWNERKKQQAAAQKAKKAEAEKERLSEVEELVEELVPLHEDPPTSQTVPYVSQSTPSSQGTAAQFKTLAEQWEERKKTTISPSSSQEKEQATESIAHPVTTISPSSPPTVEEELRQLEELAASKDRQQAEQMQIEKRQQVKSALTEQQRIDQAATEKAALEAKVQREREEQRRKVLLRQEKEKQEQAQRTLAEQRQRELLVAQELQRQAELQRLAEEEKTRQQQAELARRQEEAARQAAEEEQRLRQEEAAQRQREALAAQRQEEERQVQLQRQAEEKRKMEEQRLRQEEERKRQQEEAAQRQREAERQRQQEEAAQQRQLELQRQAEEEKRQMEEATQRKRELAARKRQQQQAAHAAELQAQEAKRQEDERRKRQEQMAQAATAKKSSSPQTTSPSPMEDIDRVVAYCHRKQQEIEQPGVSRASTHSSSSLEKQIREQREQRRRNDQAERSQQESELSQKLDDILSSHDSMEVDEESLSSVEHRPTKTEATEGNFSARSSSWYHPGASQERSQSILSMESDHISESPLVEMSQEEDLPITEASTSRPMILASGLSSIMLQRIHILVQELGGILVHQWSTQVTHLVVLTTGFHTRETRRTLKYAQAVLSGIWVVNYDWILESFHRRAWVNELVYQIHGDSTCADNIPQTARHARAKGKKPLFSGYRFYLSGKFEGIDRDALKSLITTGGGRLHSTLPRVPKTTREELEAAHNTRHWVVICDGTAFDYEAAKKVYFSSGVQPVSFEYLFDSISHYELLPTARYQILQTSTETFQSQCSQAF